MTVRERFDRLKYEFAGVYEKIKEYDKREYLAHFWEGRRENTVALHLLPVPPFEFLRRPVLRGSMSAGDKHTGPLLPLLEAGWHHSAKYDHLKSAALGHPEPTKFKGMNTDWGTVKQAYALMLLGKTTSFTLSKLKSVVEWGAGYGCMPAMLYRKFGRRITYTGIDLPIMATLQWFYLSCLFGEECVNLIQSPDGEFEGGKLNLIPIGLLEYLTPSGEVFVALNSLNESSPVAWEKVASTNWFDSTYRLLRYNNRMVEFTGFLNSEGMPPLEDKILPKHQYVCWEID